MRRDRDYFRSLGCREDRDWQAARATASARRLESRHSLVTILATALFVACIDCRSLR